MSKLRLDKYLADMGVGTRQEVKALIRKGRVAVDGITAKAPELKVDPDEAQVTVDGNSISYVKMEYWMLHKPAGVVSATEDRQDRHAFAKGLDIGDDKPTLPAELTILETTEKEPGIFESRIRITICEGRFHQIKRMFEKVGKTVVYLKRLSMGSLELDPALPKGSARLLTQEEKAALGIADAETQKGK